MTGRGQDSGEKEYQNCHCGRGKILGNADGLPEVLCAPRGADSYLDGDMIEGLKQKLKKRCRRIWKTCGGGSRRYVVHPGETGEDEEMIRRSRFPLSGRQSCVRAAAEWGTCGAAFLEIFHGDRIGRGLLILRMLDCAGPDQPPRLVFTVGQLFHILPLCFSSGPTD